MFGKKITRGLAVSAAALALLVGGAVAASAAPPVGSPPATIDTTLVAPGSQTTATVSAPAGTIIRCQWLAASAAGQTTIGSTQTQTANAWTSSAVFTSPTIPAAVSGSDTTVVAIRCQTWNSTTSQWTPSSLSDATTWAGGDSAAVLVGDTRPAWCQDAPYLTRGESLLPGQWLTSNNCLYGLTVQATDGNVVLYQLNPNEDSIDDAVGSAVAATNQFVSEFLNAPSWLVFQQSDGNVVQYLGGNPGASVSGADAVAWTGVMPSGMGLFVQDDGNLVIYAGGSPTAPASPIWARFGLPNANAGGQAAPTQVGNYDPDHFFALNIVP